MRVSSAKAGHSDGVQSFVLSEPRPLAWRPFERAMETLIALRGSDLLRVKGFLNVAGCSGPVLVQIVQHLAHPPLELASWPDHDHTSRLVFITRNISQERVVRPAPRRAGATPRLRRRMPGSADRRPVDKPTTW